MSDVTFWLQSQLQDKDNAVQSAQAEEYISTVGRFSSIIVLALSGSQPILQARLQTVTDYLPSQSTTD